MIYELPTRSPRKYRGKYPGRVNSWSYSRSSSQAIVARHLHMSRPVHVELNDGRRFILDMGTVKMDRIKLSVDFMEVPEDPTIRITKLSQERYDAMVQEIRDKGHG